MNRTTIRSILIGIILLTIPCYICAILVWSLAPDRNAPTPQPTRTPIDPFDQATNTPINPFLTPSRTPIDPFAPTTTPLLFATATVGFEPIIPTTQAFFTFTPLPTSTPFASNTPLPSATPLPTNTPLPTETQEILLPPTNTPSP